MQFSKLTYLFLLISLLSSCKFKVQDKVVPQWDVDVLGPLAKADLSLQDLADIDPITARKSISLSDLGVPVSGIPVLIPATGPQNLGPYDLDLSDAFGTAEFESGEMYFVISNELEVNVEAGTRIIIKDGSTVLLNDPLKTELAAYNGVYTSPEINVAGKTLSSLLNLELQQFKSTGTKGTVLIDTERRLIIDIYIKNVKIKKVTVTTKDIFSVADTAEFSLEGGDIKTESLSGVINTYVTSSFPVSLGIQVYFVDESKQIKLDSLFDSPAVINAMTGKTPTESKFVTTLNSTKTKNLNDAKYVRSYVKMATGTSVVIYDTTSIKVKIVGDLKVKIQD